MPQKSPITASIAHHAHFSISREIIVDFSSKFAPTSDMRYRSAGFTLPEMLAVIALIAIIISMLMPAFGTAREEGRMVVCLSNLSQLGRGTTAFAVNHKSRLPGIWGSVWVGPEDWQGCWLSNPEPGEQSWDAAPHTGTIWPFMDKNPQVYRCPSLTPAPINTGLGSNGRFDYSAFHAFAGARQYNTPKSAYLGLYDENIPTPWIIEESPYFYMNYGHVEGGFGGGDKIGAWHNGSGNYVALDTSAHRIKNSTDISSFNFLAKSPSGASVSLSSHTSGWGGWDTR